LSIVKIRCQGIGRFMMADQFKHLGALTRDLIFPL
jgi:hypothetical protein